MLNGYRTYIVAALMGVFGALAALDWNAVLADPKAGVWLVFSSIVMAGMRSITFGPAGKFGLSDPDKGSPSSLSSHAWLGVALAVALALGGCAGIATPGASTPGETAVRIGKAIYAIECKTALPGMIGAGVVEVASVRAPNGVTAKEARAAIDVNNALIAAACPAARAVELALPSQF